jgi:hypothetical protein
MNFTVDIAKVLEYAGQVITPLMPVALLSIGIGVGVRLFKSIKRG